PPRAHPLLHAVEARSVGADDLFRHLWLADAVPAPRLEIRRARAAAALLGRRALPDRGGADRARRDRLFPLLLPARAVMARVRGELVAGDRRQAGRRDLRAEPRRDDCRVDPELLLDVTPAQVGTRGSSARGGREIDSPASDTLCLPRRTTPAVGEPPWPKAPAR